jgi:FecR protein
LRFTAWLLLPLYCVCLSVFATGLTACSNSVTRHVLATVLWVRGNATWALNGSSEFKPLEPGSSPGGGSRLRTADGTKVNMALVPGALVQIGSDTEIRIEELALSKDGNETDDGIGDRVARVELKHGSIVTVLDPAARFTITTATGIINVTPGCLFFLQTGPAKTRLTCVRGKIHVGRLDETELPVEAAYVLESAGNETAVKSAADDPGAQLEIANAVQAEQQLRELQSRHVAQAPWLIAR